MPINHTMNDLISQAIAKNASLQNVTNCVTMCLKELNTKGVIYSRDIQLIDILKAINEYLETNQLDKTLNTYLLNLCKKVTKFSNGDIKLYRNSSTCNELYEVFKTAFSTLHSKEQSPLKETVPSVDTPVKAKGYLRNKKKAAKSEETVNGTWIEKQRALLTLHGMPDEYVLDTQYRPLPLDMEGVTTSRGLFISREESIAFYKQKVKVGENTEDSVSFTVAKVLFNKIPDKVEKIHVKGANKLQGTLYDITIDNETHLVSQLDLQKSTWSDKFKNTLNVINTMTNNQMVNIISLLAEKCPMIEGRLRTGLHEINGKWGYLHQNSYFQKGSSNYDVKVHFVGDNSDNASGTSLDRYKEQLEDYIEIAKIWDEKAVNEAIQYVKGLNSTKMLALISLSANIASLSKSVRNNNFNTGFARKTIGKPRQGKTSMETLTAKVGKPTSYEASTEFSGRGTITRIEKYLNTIGDMPTILDDFEPKSSSDERKFLDVYEGIAKSSYDGGPIRPRCDGDLTNKADNFCHTYPCLTGTQFPHQLTGGSSYRLFIMEVCEGDLNVTKGDYNLKTAHKLHSDGLAKLGWKVRDTHIDSLNELGMKEYANKRFLKFEELRDKFETVLTALWQTKHNEELPIELDNLISIGATILLGAYDIDTAINSIEEKIVDLIINPLANIVYNQLQLISGSRVIEGENLLTYLLKEMFERLAESRSVGGKMMRILPIDGSEEIDLTIPYKGKDIRIPKEQFRGFHDDDKREIAVIGYIEPDKSNPLEGTFYLTGVGKQMLLKIAEDSEETKHFNTPNKVSKQAKNESMLLKTSGDSHKDSLFTPKGQARMRGLALKLSVVLPLIYDFDYTIDNPTEETLEDKKEVKTEVSQDKPSEDKMQSNISNTSNSIPLDLFDKIQRRRKERENTGKDKESK